MKSQSSIDFESRKGAKESKTERAIGTTREVPVFVEAPKTLRPVASFVHDLSTLTEELTVSMSPTRSARASPIRRPVEPRNIISGPYSPHSSARVPSSSLVRPLFSAVTIFGSFMPASEGILWPPGHIPAAFALALDKTGPVDNFERRNHPSVIIGL